MNPILQNIYKAVLKDQERIQCIEYHGHNTYSLYITYLKNPNVVRPYLLSPSRSSGNPQDIKDQIRLLKSLTPSV